LITFAQVGKNPPSSFFSNKENAYGMTSLELLAPQGVTEGYTTQVRAWEPLVYPLQGPDGPDVAPPGYLTNAQLRRAGKIVGQVGNQPIIQVNADPGFLAELLPRLEGVAVIAIVGGTALAIVAPKVFSGLVVSAATFLVNMAVKLWPAVSNAIETLFTSLGEAVDDALGWSSVTDNFHWWCIFGLLNPIIPQCRAVPWYCMGPLGWFSENCRHSPHGRGGLESELWDMESYLYGKEQEFQKGLECWIENEVIDPVESFLTSDLFGPLEDVGDDIEKVLKKIKSIASDF
jgi:hypothetical protein